LAAQKTGGLLGHHHRKSLFSATISHFDYAGLVLVCYADFATGQFMETTRLLPLGRGATAVPRTNGVSLNRPAPIP
jgi:hypothetical protein